MTDRSFGATPQRCVICQHVGAPAEVQRVRCNVRRFRDRTFLVWRCAGCGSLHCETVANLAEYYADYPIRKQELDYFLRAGFRVILERLVKAGLRKQDKILDYGCNKGLFIRFLKENGYSNCVGYDPYVEQFRSKDVLEGTYDFVLNMDVIEHDDDPGRLLGQLEKTLKSGGRLCLLTPNADGIDLSRTEEFLHFLHVPYHVHILSRRSLVELAGRHGLIPMSLYERWYMDSWLPGTSRRFFETLMMLGGNDLDLGYERPRIGLLFSHPALLFYLFFGYFVPPPRNDHLMMIFAPER